MVGVHLQSPARLRREFRRKCYVVVSKALPPELLGRWLRQAEWISRYAHNVRRTEGRLALVYRVVTGQAIRDHWPELFEFYMDESIRTWIQEVTEESSIFTSAHLRSAVNLNIMAGTESVYRWHFDAVPYTVLLYLTNVRPEEGGALELIPGCQPHQVPDLARGCRVQLYPDAGTLILMDGTRCYHSVAPISGSAVRFSIPLVYPNADHAQRPAELDSYLYQPAA